MKMVQENYDIILEKIASSSGLEKSEIERRVEAKRARLSGLISKEGAAQIIAAELGISFDKGKLKLNELLSGMRKVNTLGKVLSISPVRSFTTKKGDAGKVVNLTIADETSNVKVVLWDTNHIDSVENGKIVEGVVVEIANGGMRDGEIHLGSFSELKISEENIENVCIEKVVKEKKLSELRISDRASTRAFVVQAFDPKFFFVCSKCKKKAIQENGVFSCKEHGIVSPEKRVILNIVLDDGTETMRSVLFHEVAHKIGLTDAEDASLLEQQKQNILGKEMSFTGDVRMNKFFNTPEFIIEDVREIDLDFLIQKLEQTN
jgi:ssDNA-binding replication factor A large subunit